MARLTPETKRFLRKAVAGLPLLKRSEAKDELRAHLEDAIQQRVAQGAEQSQAEQEAVTALGDVAALNRELLRAHFGKNVATLLHTSQSRVVDSQFAAHPLAPGLLDLEEWEQVQASICSGPLRRDHRALRTGA